LWKLQITTTTAAAAAAAAEKKRGETSGQRAYVGQDNLLKILGGSRRERDIDLSVLVGRVAVK
jgi:hypothetical protein